MSDYIIKNVRRKNVYLLTINTTLNIISTQWGKKENNNTDRYHNATPVHSTTSAFTPTDLGDNRSVCLQLPWRQETRSVNLETRPNSDRIAVI